jgi:hypothetical protein
MKRNEDEPAPDRITISRRARAFSRPSHTWQLRARHFECAIGTVDLGATSWASPIFYPGRWGASTAEAGEANGFLVVEAGGSGSGMPIRSGTSSSSCKGGVRSGWTGSAGRSMICRPSATRSPAQGRTLDPGRPMISYSAYRVIHLVGIFLLLVVLGAAARAGGPAAGAATGEGVRARRVAAALHGAALRPRPEVPPTPAISLYGPGGR